jgi:hypothetical protein
VRKLALGLAALLLLAGTAQATPQLPKDYHGDWCLADDGRTGRELPHGDEPAFFFLLDEGCSEDWLHVTSRGFTSRGFNMNDAECTAVEVTKFNVYPWGKRAPVNPWGPRLRVKFRCQSDGGTWTTMTWQREKDTLQMRKTAREN